MMNESAHPSNSWLDRASLWVATGFGFGYAAKAPGTIGAIWGIPLAWAVMQIPSVPGQIIVLAALYAIGIPICTSAARQLGKKDPGAVVWDEIATVPIVFLLSCPTHDPSTGDTAAGIRAASAL